MYCLYLCTNSNSPFIQNFNTVFVAETKFPEDVAFWDFYVIKVYRTGAWCSDSKFVFFLSNSETLHVAVHQKACDTFVTLKHNKNW